MFYQEPSWLQDSAHALLNQPDNRNAPQIAGAAIGTNHNDVSHVFSDSDSKPAGEYYSQDVGDAEATPAADKLAALRGPSAETIRFYDLRSGAPVVAACYLSNPVGGSAADPTWAPDGSALAWAEGDGVWMTPVGALDTTDCSWGQPRLIIPGGSQPDWGPAGTGSAGPGAPPPAHGENPVRPLAVAAPKRIRKTALLRRGLKVTITTAQPGKATATLRLGRRNVARRSKTLVSQGSAKLTLKPSRRQTPRVRRARALTLRVTLGTHVHTQTLELRR